MIRFNSSRCAFEAREGTLERFDGMMERENKNLRSEYWDLSVWRVGVNVDSIDARPQIVKSRNFWSIVNHLVFSARRPMYLIVSESRSNNGKCVRKFENMGRKLAPPQKIREWVETERFK